MDVPEKGTFFIIKMVLPIVLDLWIYTNAKAEWYKRTKQKKPEIDGKSYGLKIKLKVLF